MTTPQQPMRVQQAPTMDEVQNIIKLQCSIVMADLLKVAPELSNPAKYDEALKKATRTALNHLYDISSRAKQPKIKTEAYVGWHISCVLWAYFHPKEKDYKKCPIYHLKPIDFPGEPESTAWNYYMMGREEAAKDKQKEKGDSGPSGIEVTAMASTNYIIMVETKADYEEAYPLLHYIKRCVRQFAPGKEFILRLTRGPNHKDKANKSDANKPAEEDSRPAKRPRC
ncbi:hypothetical protein B0H65DRAFT_53275 [Neurospora tetraspora]|uniref:Uncharacterized protein n=1 Tax=Neurospora tetraspora TaxID=94610 RepID=A0AAE0MX51_9PEZI|nr:hypothetical protein B0H65DRAFT_53275 [Neurospora tetraspora]